VHGNVAEWVDFTGPPEEGKEALRLGGSWKLTKKSCAFGSPVGDVMGKADNQTGFRLVREIPE
jgi:hypothetical protein